VEEEEEEEGGEEEEEEEGEGDQCAAVALAEPVWCTRQGSRLTVAFGVPVEGVARDSILFFCFLFYAARSLSDYQ